MEEFRRAILQSGPIESFALQTVQEFIKPQKQTKLVQDENQLLENMLRTLLQELVSSSAQSREEIMLYGKSIDDGEDSQGQIPRLLDVVLYLCERDFVEGGMIFQLLEDLTEMSTMRNCKDIFGYIESKQDILGKQELFARGKLVMLRTCNQLLRRLSKANDVVFCGRILMFLAHFFPLSERSAVNIKGVFNTSNETKYEKEPPAAISLDFNFYKTMWSLQEYFCDPSLTLSPIKWQKFSSSLMVILIAFEAQPLSEEEGSANNLEEEAASFNIKYLTSSKLMGLELKDPSFRRHVLVQCLILFDYLKAPGKNDKDLTSESMKEEIKSREDHVKKLLEMTPPKGKDFLHKVEQGNQSYADKEKPLKHLIDDRIYGDSNNMNMNRCESVDSSREKGVRETPAQFKSSAVFLRPARVMDQWVSDTEGLWGRNLRTSVKRSKFPNFAYPDEGPSNCRLSSFPYESSQPVRNYYIPDKIAYLEQDPAELLRKLDGLQEQLRQSCSVGMKQRERIPTGSEIAPPDHYHGRDAYNSLMHPLPTDNHVANLPFFKHYGRGPAPYMSSDDMDMKNSYIPSKHSANEMPDYADLYQQQTPRMCIHQQHQQYLHQPLRDNFAGQYGDYSHEPLVPYPHESLHHRPACSCFHCYNKNWRIPSQASHITPGNIKFPMTSTETNFNHHVNPVTYGPPFHHPQGNPPALSSRDPQPHLRWPIGVESDMDGFPQSRPRRVVVARGNEQLCCPVAGGAPLISCYKCFELLKLPRKLREKNLRNLRCGACSALILLEIENKRLIISVPAESKQILVGADSASHEVSKEVFLNSDGCLNAVGANCSDDFDNPGYDLQSVDFKDVLSEEQKLNPSKCEKGHGLTLSSSIISEEEENLDSVVVQRDFSYASELPIKDKVPSTFQSSPTQDHSGDVLSSHAGNKCDKGNRVRWTEQENVIPEKSISSVKDDSMATEVEVPFNEYQHTSASQDSVKVSKEEDQLRSNKGTEPFLVGFIKKSFRDFSRSNQHMHNAKPNVLINGKPIPDSLVKRAAKLAGPIQPGDYWYDVRAGFWGVTGQPCLGIIPPSIEEFNHPMPENCAAGNTSVFVNGRELHQKDLARLSGRGLPITREKFYIIEISGRVFDEDTGKELDSLGRLAPTVEKTKRGFGMKVPRKLCYQGP